MPISSLSAFATRLARFALRLVFWLLAAMAITCLLVLSLGLLLLGLLRSLITGKRPQPMMKFNFQHFAKGQGAGFWPRNTQNPRSAPSESSPAAEAEPAVQRAPGRGRLGSQAGTVVDVEAREIPERPPT